MAAFLRAGDQCPLVSSKWEGHAETDVPPEPWSWVGPAEALS